MSVTAVRATRPMNFMTGPIVSAALRDSFAKLHPRVQFRNPVMFVVYLGSIYTTLIGLAAAFGAVENEGHPVFVLVIAAWLWLTVLFANFAEAVAEGRGKAQAATLRSMRQHVHAKRLLGRNRNEHQTVEASALKRGDLVLVLAQRHHPGGRRGGRRRRLGQRERGHGRVRAGASRGRRRLLGRDGRHEGAVRLARRARDQSRGRGLPRPHDRARRGREAHAHAERDRVVDPARDDDDRVPARDRHAAAVLALRGRELGAGYRRHGHGARRAPRVPDPDDDRRAAVRDRHRGHGPDGARERDRDVGPRGRSRGRRRRAAARQDRHDHARRPPRDGVSPRAADRRARARGRGAARLARGRNARGSVHRRAREGASISCAGATSRPSRTRSTNSRLRLG